MLAAVMHNKQDIKLETIRIPEINDYEILVKVKRAGICGTDLRIYRNGFPNNSGLPRILGHEFSGEVVQVGRNVNEYKVGMRVTVAPNMGCGVCNTCVKGDGHLCTKYQAIGIHLDGGFAEYVRIPENAVRGGNVVVLPDQVSYDEAAIIEPLSCVYNGLQRSRVYPGDTVLIIGAGPIGIMHALLAKLAGAAQIIISNRSRQRLEMANRVDPSFITIPSENLQEEINRLTNNEGVDVCIVACSSPEAQTLSVEVVKLNGRINFFGGLPKDKENVLINGNAIHYKQLLVTGTTKSNNEHFRKTLAFISSNLLKVDKLITARYKLEDFDQALEESINSTGIKTLITLED